MKMLDGQVTTILHALTQAIATRTTLAFMIEHGAAIDQAWEASADANEMRLLLIVGDVDVPNTVCADCTDNGVSLYCAQCADLIRKAVPRLPIEAILDGQTKR